LSKNEPRVLINVAAAGNWGLEAKLPKDRGFGSGAPRS